MFQPALRAFEPALAVADGARVNFSALVPPQTRRLLDIDWDALDLVVDLGDRLGSRRWWFGLLTLAALCSTAILLGARQTPLPEPAPAGFTPAAMVEVDAQGISPLAFGARSGRAVAPTKAVVPLAETPERPRIEVTAKLRAVDSFAGALRRAGVSVGDVATLASLIAPHADVRRLKPGTAFDVVLGRRETKSVPRPLESIAFRAAFDLRLEVARDAAGALLLKRIPIAVDDTPLRISGRVGSSLYKSARAAGLPGKLVAAYIKELGHAVDFQRDVRGADRFDIIVEHRRAETGETEFGGLLYGKLDGKKQIELMRWTSGGKAMFFGADGISLKRGLMRTPVDGARLSSGYGMRMHPILGYSRLHKGVDFAAGHGTPIMAAAGGTIVYAGSYRGYGNHVRIRHANGIETSYSHMSRFGRGATRGARVEQGEVIGYVGSTGMSTGPHLHYEVYVGGRPVDPRSAKLPTGYQLSGSELGRFKGEMARLRNLPATGTADTVAAAADPAPKRS